MTYLCTQSNITAVAVLLFFQATASYPNGNRVPHLKFKANVQMDIKGPILNKEGLGNDMGDIAMSFQIPPLAQTLFITVIFYIIDLLCFIF